MPSKPAVATMPPPIEGVELSSTDGRTVVVAAVVGAAAVFDVPVPPVASPNVGVVPHDVTAGNTPLHDPVARDAREGMPAVLVGSSGPPFVGLVSAAALEPPRPPTTPRCAGDVASPINQPINDQESRNDDHPAARLLDMPSSSTRRVIDLMADPAVPVAKRPMHPEPRPTYASTLKRATDKAHEGEMRDTLTRPTRAMLSKLLQLAEDDSTSDDDMLVAIEEALPYPKRVGTSTYWIETGEALLSESNDKLIKSLFRENQEAPWSSLLGSFVQVNKARGGDVVVTVTDDATRLGMLGQSVRLLGNTYSVASPSSSASRGNGHRQQDELQDLFYMDIVGTRFNFDSQALLKALRRLKTRPVFVCYKLTYSMKHQTSTVHPNIWRVYFNKPTPPPALLVNGHAVDQLILHGANYGVFVKDFVRSTTPRHGRISSHCMDLDKVLVATTEELHEQEVPPVSSGSKRARVTPLHHVETSPQQPIPPPLPVEAVESRELTESAETGNMIAAPAEHVGPHELEEPNDEESMTQTSAVVFQSMVDDMEVDEFIQPKKPLKRTRGETKTTSWVSETMYEALSMVDVTPRQVAMPSDVPVTSFSMDMRIPSPSTFHGRTSIRRMRIRTKHMNWHSNNLTMREIVSELQKLEDECDPLLVRESIVATASQLPENIAPLMEEARAVDLWKWICADPTKANVTLTKVFLRDSTALRTVAHLHAWHRWMVATKLPQVSSFQSGFEEVFGVPPTAAFLATAFGQHASIRATGPTTLDVTLLDIELALSAFELLLATQTAPYFYNEAWLVCMTQQPVLWLPVHKTRPMLASYTLWGLLHSTVGHQLVAAMRTGCPSELLDVLALLQAREYRYIETQMVKFDIGTVPALTFGTPYHV